MMAVDCLDMELIIRKFSPVLKSSSTILYLQYKYHIKKRLILVMVECSFAEWNRNSVSKIWLNGGDSMFL